VAPLTYAVSTTARAMARGVTGGHELVGFAPENGLGKSDSPSFPCDAPRRGLWGGRWPFVQSTAAASDDDGCVGRTEGVMGGWVDWTRCAHATATGCSDRSELHMRLGLQIAAGGLRYLA